MTAEWFSIPALVELRLPCMPSNATGIKRLADEQKWKDRDGKSRVVAGTTKPVREFHVSLLPSLAQAKLARIEAENAERAATREKRKALYWRAYNGLTDEQKQICQMRFNCVSAVEAAMTANAHAVCQTSKVEDILAAILPRYGIRKSQYYALRAGLKGVDREDWLAALAPAYAPTGEDKTVAFCHPTAWAALKSDYLRPEQPKFSACYRRMTEAAKKHKWAPIPSERSLRRRMDVEVDKAAQIYAREGKKRAEQLYPAQTRTKTHLHAMEIVNTDGHQLDLFVWTPWNKERPERVILLGIQDVFSGKILSWRLCEAETWHVVRACIGDMIEDFGIPEHIYMDNGRAFASKMISGRAKKRNRFKVDENEVAGLLKTLDIEPHFTKPYSGQSKPIERAWRDLAEEISKHPAMSGCYTGNRPDAKPENYGKSAVPLDVLQNHVAERIAEHNARTGRRSEVAAGRSFDAAFEESMRHPATIVRRATETQRTLWMLAAKVLTASRVNGAVRFNGNTYWAGDLNQWLGRELTVRFDPDRLHEPVKVYDPDGRFICDAPCTDRAGFNDSAAAHQHEKRRRTFRKRTKAVADMHKEFSPMQLGELYAEVAPSKLPAPVRPAITRIVTGNLAIEQEEVTDAISDEEFEARFQRGLSIVSGDDSSIIAFPGMTPGRSRAAK
ncbi:transposase domain-containing protein [Agrobacterium tumefaciens]|uniref:transposase domain-containing protein n=1 Tax=Agrobacterium tumefaciens TaxID=358 RepID=UPI000B33D8D9